MKFWIATILLTLAAAAIVAGVLLYTPDKTREALEAKYLARDGDMLSVAGLRLHVRDSGPSDGQALIMMHGFGAHLQTWDGWAAALEDRFRVIRFDLPGSGLSEPDPQGDYSDTRAIAILEALIDRLGIQRADLIGNSVGGRIAWRFAVERPQRVRRLVLVSPDGFASSGFDYDKAPDVPAVMSVMKHVLPKAILRSNLEVAYADNSRLSDQTVARYHDLMRAPGGRAALLQRMGTTVLVDPLPLLARITAPVLLIWGEEDRMIPVSNAEDYLSALPDARLVRLSALGHVPQEEDAARSVVPVRDFLTAD